MSGSDIGQNLITEDRVIIAADHPGRVRALYRRYFSSPRRERLFLSSVSFFVAFAITRWIAYAIHVGKGPFHIMHLGRTHVHHLVIGILLLLGVGYLWLVQVGTGVGSSSRWMSRLTSIFYGIGAAITLDEFALWLNLQDVYWAKEGRQSIDAIILFGMLLSIGLWGGPFFRGLVREATRRLRGYISNHDTRS